MSIERDEAVQGWPSYSGLTNFKSLPNLLLDAYPGASAAYATKRMSRTYTGNCIQVRRSIDNLTQDIGFLGSNLDVVSLLSFVGSSNGFVRIWYDQTSNGRDLVQTTSSQQPQIVSGGSLITDSGIPAISFDNADDSLLGSFTIASTTASLFLVANTVDTSWMVGSGSNGVFVMCTDPGSGSSPDSSAGTPFYYRNNGLPIARTRGSLATAYAINQKMIAIAAPFTTTNFSLWRVFSFNGGAYHLNGLVSGLFLWPTDKTVDKSGINAIIANSLGVVV